MKGISLAQLVCEEFGVPLNEVMLLRHSSGTVSELLKAGASLEEYTFTQPQGSKFDYAHPEREAIRVVVVIVNDRVHAVYQVLGIEARGTTYTLTSESHRQFDIDRGKPPRDANRFEMKLLPSVAVGQPVSGWEGRSRTPVQRKGGGFFLEITVPAAAAPVPLEAFQRELDAAIVDAIAADPAKRALRLALAPKIPRRVSVTSVAFVRNPDVIAEVLLRARGRCELCRIPAPFNRRYDDTPYLEVHHKIRLADGGEDTVENAVAACPNCHRREHYG